MIPDILTYEIMISEKIGINRIDPVNQLSYYVCPDHDEKKVRVVCRCDYKKYYDLFSFKSDEKEFSNHTHEFREFNRKKDL